MLGVCVAGGFWMIDKGKRCREAALTRAPPEAHLVWWGMVSGNYQVQNATGVRPRIWWGQDFKLAGGRGCKLDGLDFPPSQFADPSLSAFRDQVKAVAGWFGDWNACEQTIGLYSLLCQISSTQARFLALVLDHRFKHEPPETDVLEQEANDPGGCWLSRIYLGRRGFSILPGEWPLFFFTRFVATHDFGSEVPAVDVTFSFHEPHTFLKTLCSNSEAADFFFFFVGLRLSRLAWKSTERIGFFCGVQYPQILSLGLL